MMTSYNKGEIKLVVQGLLAIFIGYTLVRFLNVYATNFTILGAVGTIAGLAILYFCFSKSKELYMFVGYTLFISVPISAMYYFMNW